MNILKLISILGSTGSIGTQTIDVVKRLKNIKVLAITANNNIDLLEKQAFELEPKLICVMDKNKAECLKERIKGKNIKVLSGMEGLIEAATLKEIDTVVTSVVGNVGLLPTIEAIKNKKNIALANKETLVSAGELIMSLAKENNINIYPVDSEHSAIFQCLQGNKENRIKKILLTASGGPFRTKSYEELKGVTLEQALNHPNWAMGKKITIDSSTMINKGLEMIEAKWLYDVEPEQIEIVVHPQSVVHSAVEFEDGSIIAQLGQTDMRIPIQYALTYPKRIETNLPKLDLTNIGTLTFEKPNFDTFKCLSLAYRAIKGEKTLTAVMNAANEIAVSKFLNNDISFIQIPDIIEMTMNSYNNMYDYSLEGILKADNWAREYAQKIL